MCLRSSLRKHWAAIGLVGASVGLHAFFAWHQPFTNDEGAYLYDARTILEGELPAGDVLTKAPVPIILFAIGELITGESLFAARIVNSIASITTALPLFLLLKLLADKRAAWLGAAIWLLGSGTIVFHTIGHTQAIASLFAVSCLYLFVAGIRHTKIVPKYIFLAGLCFALAYASRKTAIAVSIPLVFSWVIFRYSNVEAGRVLRIFLFGVLSIFIPWMIGIYALYGLGGIWHMLGGAYGDMLVHSGSIEAWAGSSDRMFSEAMRIGSVYGLFLVVICIAIMRELVLIGASWVATLGVLYFLWPTHLVEYLADFIPSIVIAGSVAIASLRLLVWQNYLIASIFLFANIASLQSVYMQPWTGMFARSAITESAAYLAQHVPLQEKIFTAAVIIPYLSGHEVPFHLSHPQWYRYDFISKKDKDVFLPSYEQVQKTAHENISWLVRDQLTDYVYPGIISDTFQEVHVVPNDTQYRQNPLRTYFAEDR